MTTDEFKQPNRFGKTALLSKYTDISLFAPDMPQAISFEGRDSH